MTDAPIRFARRRSDMFAKDRELILDALQESLRVIDHYDADRNPARCMRQLRRIFDNPELRAAITRLAAGIPRTPK